IESIVHPTYNTKGDFSECLEIIVNEREDEIIITIVDKLDILWIMSAFKGISLLSLSSPLPSSSPSSCSSPHLHCLLHHYYRTNYKIDDIIILPIVFTRHCVTAFKNEETIECILTMKLIPCLK
ncbi:7719_t:CDS:2, partial [Diversispora eburnea]